MRDYSKGFIYYFYDVATMNVLYVGSSVQRPYARKSKHKSDMRHETSPWYQHLRSIGWDAVVFREKENWPCTSQRELNIREQWHLDKVRLEQPTRVFNQKRAFMTLQDRRRQWNRYDASPKGHERRERQRKKKLEKKDETPNTQVEGCNLENQPGPVVPVENQGHSLTPKRDPNAVRIVHTGILPPVQVHDSER